MRSTGTVNALFRVGDSLCARLPLVERWATDIERELEWLPWLGPQLSMRVPAPVAAGQPTDFCPFPWAVYGWIEGSPYSDELIDDERSAAGDLARFVLEVRALGRVDHAPRGGRQPLRLLDRETRAAIEASRRAVDADAAMKVWERSLDAPAWDERDVWIHGDLLRPNLLVDGGRLSAVIDFGGIGAGDPATDLMPAWSVFGERGRDTYRTILDVDDGTWARGRGIALHQAVNIIPYYASNASFVARSKRAIDQILVDAQLP